MHSWQTSVREHKRQRPVPKLVVGGRKPWKQKGTGHARQGSTRSPQWKGGGVVFAPTPRDYTINLNKKEKRIALKSALTSRVLENKFIVVDDFAMSEIKTKKMQQTLNNLNVKKGACLYVLRMRRTLYFC